MIPLYWHQSNNFGDALSPWLVEKITGERPTPVTPAEGRPFIVTGSIFKGDLPRGIVWGAGCAFEWELENINPPGELEIVAMRGAVSTKAVEKAGHSPAATGDPGFLVPCFYTPKQLPKIDVAIMCSWVDYDDVIRKFPGVPVINSMDAIERVVDQICACTLLLSSSLHGLVVAEAYGVDTRWVSFSDRMIGDGFKYRDVGFGQELRLSGGEDLSTVLPVSVTIPDTKALLDCCPFKGAS